MTAVGPELARALGGTWDADGVVYSGVFAIQADSRGKVWLTWTPRMASVHIGSLSDGADTLAARARELGAGT